MMAVGTVLCKPFLQWLSFPKFLGLRINLQRNGRDNLKPTDQRSHAAGYPHPGSQDAKRKSDAAVIIDDHLVTIGERRRLAKLPRFARPTGTRHERNNTPWPKVS